MAFRIYGSPNDFYLTAERSFYNKNVATNSTIERILGNFGGCLLDKPNWAINLRYQNMPAVLFEDFLEFFKKFNFKYSVAMGAITIAMFDETQIILSGYIKSNVAESLRLYRAKLICINKEECYLLPLKKYSNIVLLFERRKLCFADRIANSENKEVHK